MKKFMSKPWVIAIVSPLIVTAIISGITALNKKINIWEAVMLVLSNIWKWIFDLLKFEVPMYDILIVTVVIFLFLHFYSKLSNKNDKNNDLLKYKKEFYKDWNFEWEYELNDEGEYEINKLRPVCDCGCDLSVNKNPRILSEVGSQICPNCKNIYPHIEPCDISDCKKVLYNKIKTQTFSLGE